MNQVLVDKISSTSKTALLTIYAHSIESESIDPILKDSTAVSITEALYDTFINSNDRLLRNLAKGKYNKQLVYHICLRAKKYDSYANDFVKKHPEGTIINIGCGLDSRYQRLENKPKLYIDVDLKAMIDIKKTILKESSSYKMIGESIFSDKWLNELKHIKGPKLFIAEGLFMYLKPDDLNPWLINLANEFSGSYLLFETVSKKYTKGFNKKMVEFKLRKELGVTGDVSYHFGLDESNDLEKLSDQFHLIEDWSYFDERNPKVGWMNLMGKFQSLKYVQWTVFYIIK